MNKICIACNKRPARIKFVKIVDGKWQDCMICQTCAMRFASQQGANTLLKLDHILQGLMEQGALSEEGGEAAGKLGSSASTLSATDLTCTGCGLSFVSYRNSLILGCSECYRSFRDRLMEDLRRFHGATSHAGRRPKVKTPGEAGGRSVEAHAAAFRKAASHEAAAAVPKPDLSSLKRQLQEAVQEEDFETAAKLRDRIRELETDEQEERQEPS